MKTSMRIAFGLVVALGVTATHADVRLLAGRVAADDVEGLAKFYVAAFGMQEVNRFKIATGTEIFLNFGDTVEAAKKNTATPIAVLPRAAGAIIDTVPHLLFGVSDISAAISAVKAAGGAAQGDPIPFGNSGMILGFVVDPAGNRLELVQTPKQP